MDLPTVPQPEINLSNANDQSWLQGMLSDPKKKVMLIVAVFCVLALGAIIAGIIFSPSGAPKDIRKSFTTQKPTSKNTHPLPVEGQADAPTEVPTIASYNYAAEATPEVYGTLTPTPSPSPTPLPGPFYIPNGKQNNLDWELSFEHNWDIFAKVYVINTKTTERRTVGRAFISSPGDSTFFSKDFSQLIFIGGKLDENDYEKINFYSIPKNTIIKQISLADMKRQLPTLTIMDTAVLSRLTPSPNGTKAAFSYGNTWDTEVSIDPGSVMIILDLQTYKLSMLKARGLVSSWKDDNTIVYETTSTYPTPNPTAEAPINDIQN